LFTPTADGDRVGGPQVEDDGEHGRGDHGDRMFRRGFEVSSPKSAAVSKPIRR